MPSTYDKNSYADKDAGGTPLSGGHFLHVEDAVTNHDHPAIAGYANLAALPAASAANRGFRYHTADGGWYESDGSTNQAITPPTDTSAAALKRTTVKTADYTASLGDLIPVDTSTPNANITITLPTPTAVGSRIAVKYIAVGTGKTATVVTSGGDKFNKTGGPTSLTLTLANQAISLQWDNGIWTVVGDDLPLAQLDSRFVLATGPVADLPFNNHKATGVTDPTNPQDAATKAYSDAQDAATLVTATSTGAAIALVFGG